MISSTENRERTLSDISRTFALSKGAWTVVGDFLRDRGNNWSAFDYEDFVTIYIGAGWIGGGDTGYTVCYDIYLKTSTLNEWDYTQGKDQMWVLMHELTHAYQYYKGWLRFSEGQCNTVANDFSEWCTAIDAQYTYPNRPIMDLCKYRGMPLKTHSE